MSKYLVVYKDSLESVADWFDSDSDLKDVFVARQYGDSISLYTVMPYQFDDDGPYNSDVLDEIDVEISELGLTSVTDILNAIAKMEHMKYVQLKSNEWLFYKGCNVETAVWYYSVIEDSSEYSHTYVVIADASDKYSKSDLAHMNINSIYDYDINEVDPDTVPFTVDTEDFRCSVGDIAYEYARKHGGLAKFISNVDNNGGYNESDLPKDVLDLR